MPVIVLNLWVMWKARLSLLTSPSSPVLESSVCGGTQGIREVGDYPLLCPSTLPLQEATPICLCQVQHFLWLWWGRWEYCIGLQWGIKLKIYWWMQVLIHVLEMKGDLALKSRFICVYCVEGWPGPWGFMLPSAQIGKDLEWCRCILLC